MNTQGISFFTHRIMLSRIFVAVVIAFAFTAGPLNFMPEWTNLLSEMFGYILLSAAALGRIWCLLFIAGRKNKILTTEGPYSVSRNPLYLFSFIGVVGFGLAVEKPLLALILALFFIAFYPSVVRGEEKHLKALYGAAFDDYCGNTPRWLPDFSLYREPATLEVDPLRFRKGILDAMWFLWAFLLWEIVEGLHGLGIIPFWY